MSRTYSLYAAKARLSEIVRRVREGDIVTISYRGKPVAEIRPIPKGKQSLDERIQERGVIVGSGKPAASSAPSPAGLVLSSASSRSATEAWGGH